MENDFVSSNPLSINKERSQSLIEKWFPVLCTDEEYKERYGKERETPKIENSIIIESQESFVPEYLKIEK